MKKETFYLLLIIVIGWAIMLFPIMERQELLADIDSAIEQGEKNNMEYCLNEKTVNTEYCQAFIYANAF